MAPVALITGAGSGIGQACALALSKEGYAVVLAGRRPEALQDTIDKAGPGADLEAVQTDVTDPAQVRALFAATKQKYGRLDLLFNNAGTGSPPGLLEDMEYETWKRVVDTNLTGSFLCTQEAFKIMKDQDPRGGRIVNNGSISAHAPRPNSVAYTSTKHAITGLTKSTALDGRKYDIACGQLDIGNARTQMADRMTRGILQPNGETMVEATMDVEDVAKALVFMAGLSLDSNVQFMTVMATKMPFLGRG
jgi:NAD(P)-dependent dehydrogenase (short-subunit alcohol dehydrogenase family)